MDSEKMPLKIGLIASSHPLAQSLSKKWHQEMSFTPPEEAETLLVLGGDGMMLHALREYPHARVYGLHIGTVGFLMNTFHGEDFDLIQKRIQSARDITLHPLKLEAITSQGASYTAHAINEVSLLRMTAQAAKIAIYVDEKLQMEELTCDGVLLSTPAGSTAYNLSAHGPIIPLTAQLLALTPISPFRPRRWRGALLPDASQVEFRVLNPDHRRVGCFFDDKALSHPTQKSEDVMPLSIESVKMRQDKEISYTLLFDPDHHLEDRIISEQFGG